MPELYPLLLLPEFRERVWGTRDLSLLYPHKSARGIESKSDQPIGEVWLTGEDCRVANGPLAGQTLDAVTRRFGAALVGDHVTPSRFPLLLKFLFPKQKLSVQVHPDDEGARAVGQSCGKTECWYVLAAEPGAQVGLGLKPGVSKEEVATAIREQRMEQLLNWIDVKPGELIYVDAGTVHAIGPGSILVETQQNSDTTYRLYDYGRPRELHVEQGLAATKLSTRAGKVARQGMNGHVNLVSSPCFRVDKVVARELHTVTQEQPGASSVSVLVALDGAGVIECDGMMPVTVAKGECAVVPASVREFRIRPQWAIEILRASVPGPGAAEPETVQA